MGLSFRRTINSLKGPNVSDDCKSGEYILAWFLHKENSVFLILIYSSYLIFLHCFFSSHLPYFASRWYNYKNEKHDSKDLNSDENINLTLTMTLTYTNSSSICWNTEHSSTFMTDKGLLPVLRGSPMHLYLRAIQLSAASPSSSSLFFKLATHHTLAAVFSAESELSSKWNLKCNASVPAGNNHYWNKGCPEIIFLTF